MNINELKIGEVKEIVAMFGNMVTLPAQARVEHGVAIVVLDRGFVYVGRVATDGEWVYIDDCRNIRYWGTERGLGELVDGPTPKTKIDYVGELKAPLRALISIISTKGDNWKKS